MEKKVIIDEKAINGMKTELKARMIMGLPDDDYKKGFNDAMKWAIDMVKLYEKGDGLFQ